MKADSILKTIVKEVSDEMWKESYIDFSEMEIADIVNSEFYALNLGIRKRFDVRLPFIGRFIDIDRSNEIHRKTLSKIEIEELRMEEGDYVATKEELRRKIETLNKIKEMKKVKPKVSFKSIMRAPSTHRAIKTKYEKILEDE